jgi:hypothetical protein
MIYTLIILAIIIILIAVFTIIIILKIFLFEVFMIQLLILLHFLELTLSIINQFKNFYYLIKANYYYL